MREEDSIRIDEAREGAQPVQSVDRALRILELLASQSPLSVSALGRELGVHRSTAFRLLATLEARRFVARRGDGSYELGTGALRIAGSVAARVDFAGEAQRTCEEVTARTGETSNVAILIDGAAVNIAQATGTGSVVVRDQFVGQRTPLHATSSGKVLLAFADEQTVIEAASRLERFSDTTIVLPDRLRAEMALVRSRGWASAVAEWQEHTNAVAVPVIGDAGVIAALSVTAPDFRMPEGGFSGFAAQLRECAEELSRRLGH